MTSTQVRHALAAIALAEALAIAFLLWRLAFPATAATPPNKSLPPAPPHHAAAPESPSTTREASSDRDVEPGAKKDDPPSTAPRHPEIDLGIVVHGALYSSAGRRLPDGVAWLSTEDNLTSWPSSAAGGAYSVVGVKPGRYQLVARAKHHHDLTAPLEVPADVSTVRRDLTLQKCVVLRVLLFTPDGQPLAGKLRESSLCFDVIAVATRDRPGARLVVPEGTDLRRHGLGRWHAAQHERPLPPADVHGELQLEAPPPLFVSLVHGGAVLDTRAVAPGETDVRFELTLAAIERTYASVCGEFFDPAKEGPIALHVAASDPVLAAGGGVRSVKTTDGRFHIDKIEPGRYTLEAVRPAPPYERSTRLIELLPEQHLDLGRIPFRPLPRVVVTVRDAGGQPVEASLQAARTGKEPQPIDFRSSFQVARGRAELRLGDGAWLLKVDMNDAGMAFAGVHVAPGEAPRVDLALAPTCDVGILRRDSFGQDTIWTIRDARGLLVWGMPRSWASRARLPRGSYTLEIHAADRLLRAVPFTATGAQVVVTVQ
jgi:hypothetical protein